MAAANQKFKKTKNKHGWMISNQTQINNQLLNKPLLIQTPLLCVSWQVSFSESGSLGNSSGSDVTSLSSQLPDTPNSMVPSPIDTWGGPGGQLLLGAPGGGRGRSETSATFKTWRNTPTHRMDYARGYIQGVAWKGSDVWPTLRISGISARCLAQGHSGRTHKLLMDL